MAKKTLLPSPPKTVEEMELPSFLSVAHSQRQTLFLSVHVKPNAKKSEIVGVFNGRLKIAIKAPPQEGKANHELIVFLAKTLQLSLSHLSIVQGLSSKEKRIAIDTVEDIKTIAVRITSTLQ